MGGSAHRAGLSGSRGTVVEWVRAHLAEFRALEGSAPRPSGTGGLQTHRWREPDSNHRSRSCERSLGCCRREMPLASPAEASALNRSSLSKTGIRPSASPRPDGRVCMNSPLEHVENADTRQASIPLTNETPILRRQRKSDQIESCRSAGDRNELEGNWRQPFEHDDPCAPLGEARFERLVLGRASRLDGLNGLSGGEERIRTIGSAILIRLRKTGLELARHLCERARRDSAAHHAGAATARGRPHA